MINGSHHPYVQAAIDGEVVRLGAALEGQRNDALFKCVASLASLGVAEGEIIRNLKPAAESIGLRGSEFYKTVKSGAKAGYGNPRQVPTAAPKFTPGSKVASETKPFFILAGDEGPSIAGDERRRHVYRREGAPVRIKIKKMSGAWTNWYRVSDARGAGWQAGKPADYVAVPYVGDLDPFDHELNGDLLYWPEGEKDCDNLGKAALPAFTFGGTGDGLPKEASDYVRGRHVIILADNDPSGQEHALKKARVAYVVAQSVRIVTFPELPAKSDVSDYLQVASAADLERRCSEAPLWSPEDGPPERSKSWRTGVISASELREKTFKPISYVVPGYVPEGVTVFAGKPKIGKSWLLYDVCLAAAADRFVLGTIKPAQGDVLYLALEDSQRRLKSRLNKLCRDAAWPSRLSLATEWKRADQGGIDDIADWCDGAAKPVLVVIDTLEKFRQLAKPGSSAYTTDYLAISALHKLAHDRGIAIVVIHHVRKMEADDPFDMVSGTNGLTGAADTILVLKKQAGNVTLYARGRDIEEKESACQFDKSSCRWTLLGDADAVHRSTERSAIVAALRAGGESGLHITEIMAAIDRRDRNAVDQLLFKMQSDGDITRLKRGVYSIADKIGKKERNESQAADWQDGTTNLTDLTDLTMSGAPQVLGSTSPQRGQSGVA